MRGRREEFEKRANGIAVFRESLKKERTMSHTRQRVLGLAALVAVMLATSVASAGPLRFAGRVAVRAPVVAARAAVVATPPYRPYYRPYYSPYYRTYAPGYYYNGYGYRPYY